HTAGETQTSLAMHRPILAAIEDSDPDAAREAMTSHMARAVHRLRESMPSPLDHRQLPD
ncbi:MAG: GntR family transcriptional regulator, transcriptional repressor for pyruvate dehydrogenase complex, partial [Pseudonocardiales bacterium]|nr:GntR family transcriptional regulator, transcriptional repressor for pyruvate dehydrogenase complex [Pseudonocardiales bacterium]